ncbi:MAG: SDR family NAD(P)-dependent oxidoreductase [Thermoanaerobaculia bacterium]
MMTYEPHTVLVSGGTGSFGREMVRALLAKGCKEIRILSRDEAKQEAMRVEYASDALKFIIGDVRSRASVDKAMRGVDLVFHAAALKQVPSCEFFPLEAVQTNVMGSANVIESAVAHGVAHVVCLSTDKAVMPINAMGMTKALMEKTAQSTARELGPGDTVVSCVRYGNVMYSRGSVIPLFIDQIKNGRPITVTEPRMTRFMLALPEAIELVEFAFHHAEQGEIFIKKAPACTIELLAETLSELFEAPNDIRTIGMRHGEKLYETLASAEELRRSEDMGDYFRVRLDIRDLNYAKYFTEGDPGEASTDDYNSRNTRRLDKAQLRELLLCLPEVRRERDAWLKGRKER